MALKLPPIIGHRGACGYAPENTIESVRTAHELGAKWVELDVKLTKDGTPIIFHDEDLDRTTNGAGPVMLATLEDIRQLEAGSWFGDSFAGIAVPTLEEMVDVLLELGLGLNLEIKPCPTREVETAEAALDVLSRIWDDHDSLLISSFSHVSLEAAQSVASDWKRGLLIHDENELPANWRDICDYLDCATVNINQEIATRDAIESIMDFERQVAVYTVNDPMVARRLQSWGVDSLFTDVPDVIAENILTVH
ncbi:MAG: glycerophosphoryl diester phosphodiesterase [Alphaproteobacteria bacterium]|nr:glycerophosphoryl diester phosphodiesterase [Alphaproteobacteria bacterium]MBU0859265.1 glycerophosphoryl diester phosphodiesterase [Alphaproteobacteria bacterium]